MRARRRLISASSRPRSDQPVFRSSSRLGIVSEALRIGTLMRASGKVSISVSTRPAKVGFLEGWIFSGPFGWSWRRTQSA